GRIQWARWTNLSPGGSWQCCTHSTRVVRKRISVQNSIQLESLRLESQTRPNLSRIFRLVLTTTPLTGILQLAQIELGQLVASITPQFGPVESQLQALLV